MPRAPRRDEGLQKFPVDQLTYCWLPSHWHMAFGTWY